VHAALVAALGVEDAVVAAAVAAEEVVVVAEVAVEVSLLDSDRIVLARS
jgi:hypothetical protein